MCTGYENAFDGDEHSSRNRNTSSNATLLHIPAFSVNHREEVHVTQSLSVLRRIIKAGPKPVKQCFSLCRVLSSVHHTIPNGLRSVRRPGSSGTMARVEGNIRASSAKPAPSSHGVRPHRHGRDRCIRWSATQKNIRYGAAFLLESISCFGLHNLFWRPQYISRRKISDKRRLIIE